MLDAAAVQAWTVAVSNRAARLTSVASASRRRGVSLCLALLALCGLSNCEGPACSSRPLAVLPLTEESSGLYVQVGVDGRMLKLLLDTGSTRTLLTSGTARLLGLRVEHLLDDTDVLDGYAVNGVGGRRHIDRGWPHRIELGLAPIIATPVSIVWSGDASWDPAGDGILGMDLLSRYDLDLDLAGQQVSLFAPGTSCVPPGSHSRPLRALSDMTDGPWLIVSVGGVTFRALIDTGAQHSFIMASAASRIGETAKSGTAGRKFQVVGVGSAREPAVLRVFDQLVVGDAVIPKLDIAVIGTLRGPGVILGDDVLRRLHVRITANGKLFIAQPSS